MSLAGPCFSSGSALWLSQYGIGRMRQPNLLRVLIAQDATETRAHANSPHPTSRKGRRSTGWRILDLLLFGGQAVPVSDQAAAVALSFVQRNSVPSLQRRCMITANRRARATMAFCKPRRRATFMAQAFNQDHFCTRVSST
jgi:hypothetical protein